MEGLQGYARHRTGCASIISAPLTPDVKEVLAEMERNPRPCDCGLKEAMEATQGALQDVTKVSDPCFIVVWDPGLVTPKEYAAIIDALGDIVRAAGFPGIKRIESSCYTVATRKEGG